MNLIIALFGLLVVANCNRLEIISRQKWLAKPPTQVEHMNNPVPYVIIHHSYIPPACHTTATCIAAMQTMQEMHQVGNGWNDIGYSFGAGGDGKIYEGRGWSHVGAHAPVYNNKSIGICLIGDWRNQLPPPQQIEAVQNLINYGVQHGYIRPDYILHGHRQVRNGTECPGDALFNEISSWDHFSMDVAYVHQPAQ